MSRVHETTLTSGIKVITEEMPEAESSTIGVWVRTGSRNETKKINGISHLIEHMLFKGTVRRSALDISREIESVGGVLNAFTSREYTCFYAKVLNKDVSRAADLLSDIFMNSTFDGAELDKERMVILQEIKMVEDTPDDIIHDLYSERFWKGHPLGYSILGTEATIGSMDRDAVLDYYRRHYLSDKVFITAAGGVRHGKLTGLLKGTFGKIKMEKRETGLKPPTPTPGVRLVMRDLEQVHFCLGVPVPPQADPGRYRLYLLNTILGSGMSSRLFQEIREKRGLAYSIFSYLSLYKDTGALTVYSAAEKKSFSKIVRLVLKGFSDLRKGVSAKELREAKSHLKGSMLLGLETSENRMTKLARDEIYFGEIIPISRIVKTIDRVTPSEIKKTAKEILDPAKLTLAAIGKVRGAKLPAGLKRLGQRGAGRGAKAARAKKARE
jgi:predicted Zn-dependent peptidase